MELLQLHYFCAVARHESISSAAEELHITQPALSRAIARLENDVGIKLFIRTGRGIALSDAGHLFRTRVESALRELSDGVEELQRITDRQINYATCVRGVLAAPAEAYIRDYPDAHLNQYILRRHEITAALRSGEIDFGVYYSPIHEPDMEFSPLFRDRLMVLLSNAHPLAREGRLSLMQLKEERLLFGDANIACRDEICDYYRSQGSAPQILYEGVEDDVIASLVENGRGIYILPLSIGQRKIRLMTENRRAVSAAVITEDICSWTTGIATLKNHYMAPNVRSFLNRIKAYYRRLYPDGRIGS